MNARLREWEGVANLRVPPQSMEAEQSLLGALMTDPKALGRIKLDPADFYRRDHGEIFRAILDLDAEGKPYDAVTLADHFAEAGKMAEAGAYLVELASSTWTTANAEAHAKIVRDKAVLRRVIEVGNALVNDGFIPDGRDSAQIIDTAVRELMGLAKADARCEFSMRDAVRMAWDDAAAAHELQGQLRGVTTGFERVDKRLGGWHRGDLVILAARPSMGKTALMVNLALAAAKAGHGVGMVSGEQSAMQIGQRSVSMEARVAAECLRNGEIDEDAWPKLTDAMRRLVERKVRIYDRSAPTLDEIARLARRWKQEHGIAVLFVDYLQRIRCRAESRIEEVSEVARGLKTLARDLDIPVIALAQVKAEVDKRPDKRPGLGDVANSDEATREADLIGFLYRGEVYDDNAEKGVAELNFEKNRHGPTGQFRLAFQGETMTFADLAAQPWGM